MKFFNALFFCLLCVTTVFSKESSEIRQPTSEILDTAPLSQSKEEGAASKIEEEKYKLPFLIFGDLRHRYEFLYNEQSGKEDHYNQMRLRARLGAKASPTPDLDLEFRFATGPGGVSTNQTYEDGTKGSRNYEFKLDRAFAQWKPQPWGRLMVGRMTNPFLFVGGHDMIFDSDLNFDGIAVALSEKWQDLDVTFTASEFLLDESKDNKGQSDMTLTAGQLALRAPMSTDFSWAIVASHLAYSQVKDHAAVVPDGFFGNSNAGSVYLSDFQINSLGGELTYLSTLPVTLFYEFSKNAKASDLSRASIFGVRWGQLKKSKDWALTVDMREVEKDSLLGLLTDGDSFGGGANGRSLRLSAGYNYSKSMTLVLTGLQGKKSIAPGEDSLARDRLQLDLNFKF